MDALIDRDEVVRRLRGHYHGRYEICTEADLDWAVMGSAEGDAYDYWPSSMVLDHLADLIESAAPDMSRFMELPTDADGVPIRIGDVIEWPVGDTVTVCGIGEDCVYYVDDATGNVEWTKASTKSHAKLRTIEDVLREFAERVCNSGHQWGLDADGTIAEFAEKLQSIGMKAAQQ